MKQAFFDLDIITNNLEVEHKLSQEIGSFNGYPVCVVSLQGDTDWRISQSDKFIYVCHGTIALDVINYSQVDNQNNIITKLVGLRQGLVVSGQVKYRIRAAELSHVLIIGQEDKIISTK